MTCLFTKIPRIHVWGDIKFSKNCPFEVELQISPLNGAFEIWTKYIESGIQGIQKVIWDLFSGWNLEFQWNKCDISNGRGQYVTSYLKNLNIANPCREL